MREPDVRLSDDERATFESLVRQLCEPVPTARRRQLWRWTTMNRFRASGAACAAVGTCALIAGLLSASPALGLAGFAAVVTGAARATRRLTWAWAVLRWRRCSAPPATDHMWEP